MTIYKPAITSVTMTPNPDYGLMPPKTDWTARDYENAEDFNRQKHNIKFIATGLLHELYYFPDHSDIDEQDMTDIPTIGLVNLIEDNLAKIESCGITLPIGWEMSKIWVTGGIAPDYTDINRWERNPLLMYEMAALIDLRFRPAGTFAAGQTNILPTRRVI